MKFGAAKLFLCFHGFIMQRNVDQCSQKWLRRNSLNNGKLKSDALSKRNKWVAKSFIFLAAFLSMLFSIFLFHSGDTQNGIFVGIWVPSILSAGSLLMVGLHD